MAKHIILNKSFIRVMFVLFATILVGQKPQDVSGTVLDGKGNRVVETTVLLLAEDGTEVQRTQTSKKRLGRGGGVFEFKKVVPGSIDSAVNKPAAKGAAKVFEPTIWFRSEVNICN